MRRAYKITGIVVLVPIVLLAVIFVGMRLDVWRNGMPADSPRVVETDDYRFEAPDGWITACADKTPGCLAVVPKDRNLPLWDMRAYWIEVHPVDSAGVTSPQSLTQRALDAVRLASQAAGGDPAQLIQADSEPRFLEGVQMLDIVDPSATAFSRSRVVQLPAGNILRFTCYAKVEAEFKEHDDGCFANLNQLHFPKAAALAAEQERVRQQQEEQAQLQAAADAQARATEQRAPPPAEQNAQLQTLAKVRALSPGCFSETRLEEATVDKDLDLWITVKYMAYTCSQPLKLRRTCTGLYGTQVDDIALGTGGKFYANQIEAGCSVARQP